MKQNQKDIQQILLSRPVMLITSEGFAALLAEASPENEDNGDDDVLPYEEASRLQCELMASQIDGENPVSVTTEYASEEIPDGSIAYYPIMGTITSGSCWFFSSKRFEKELLAAEHNPRITAHFLHISSPGGEAFYLDRLSQTMDALAKPVVVYAEKVCASAAYLIACHADEVLAATGYDKIGSIGTAAQFINDAGAMEKWGYKTYTYHAEASDLKNKVTDDALSGKGEDYIRRFLNPLNDMFLACVRANRPALAQLPDDSPVLRGEIFLTPEAIELGLVDAQATFTEAVARCVELGRVHADIQRTKNKLISII